MRILVTFAVEAEFAPWRKLRTLEPVNLQGLEMFRTHIGRATVDFLVTGMGMAGVMRQHYPRALLYPAVLGLLIAFGAILVISPSVFPVVLVVAIVIVALTATNLPLNRRANETARSLS